MGLFSKLFGKSVTIEDQLAALAKTGIYVNAGVTEDDLTAFQPRAKLESKPFAGLIEVLAMDIEREPFAPKCDRLWMCDFERIEDHGAYREIVERLERMTGNALGLKRLADHVDVEQGKAWVEFDRAGQRVHWDFRVENDWLDPEVFGRYQALLQAAGSKLRLFVNQRDYGQSALLAAFTREEKAAFDAISRVQLQPLDPQG